MHKIKLLVPRPIFRNIVNFKIAVWWYPGFRWRVEVNTGDNDFECASDLVRREGIGNIR